MAHVSLIFLFSVFGNTFCACDVFKEVSIVNIDSKYLFDTEAINCRLFRGYFR